MDNTEMVDAANENAASSTRKCKYLAESDLEEECFGECKWTVKGFSELQAKLASSAEERKILSPIYTTSNKDKW